MKDKMDRAARLAKRDAIIKAIFEEMRQDNLPFMECYTLLGDFFGLGVVQIIHILNHQTSLFSLAETNVVYFAVLLQRISDWSSKSAG